MSTEKNDAESALTALGVGPAAKEAYVDLLRPAARIVGRDLEVVARAISLAISPLRGVVWGLEKVQDWLATALLRRLAAAKPEEIQSPPPYIAGQLLLQLQFCADQEQLRELYANLLASAMLHAEASAVHPAFVQVIQQLTPDEALLLHRIAQRGKNFSLREVFATYGGYQGAEGPISDQFRRLCEEAGVSQPTVSDAYLDNLLRLKLLSEQPWSESEYQPPGSEDVRDLRPSIKNVSGRDIEISAFGQHFIRTCVLPEFTGWHAGA